MITVFATTTNYLVTATNVEQNVSVSVDDATFTVTTVEPTFTVTNFSPVISFLTEGAGFDFVTKNRGQWISGEIYTRNDVVYFEYSTYICAIAEGATLSSSQNPKQDTASWELFIFQEWPMASLTVNGNADIYGDIRGYSNASIGGVLQVDGRLDALNTVITGTLTATNINVLSTLTVAGIRYPSNTGIYGQVLFTNGADRAAWVNLGELVFWSLSNDLYTNGFSIYSGHNVGQPHPQLTIGTGDGSNLTSYLRFAQTPIGNRGDVTLYGDAVDIQAITLDLDSPTTRMTGNAEVDDDLTVRGDLLLTGTLSGASSSTPVGVSSGGIRFADGTVQTSASTSTGFTVTQIASETRLGVIRVGNYLTINSSTGVLSVDAGNLPSTYVLPAAASNVRGGIRVGLGLNITDGDILNITTSSIFGNISLLADMDTNGFKIRYNTSTQNTSYIDVNQSNIDIKSDVSNLTLGTTANLIASTTTVAVSDGLIDLKAAQVRIGHNVNGSFILVNRLYDYTGTGPPFFPAGVQYQDNTIQRTAWRGYDQGLV